MAHLSLVLIVVLVAIAVLLGKSTRCTTTASWREFMTPMDKDAAAEKKKKAAAQKKKKAAAAQKKKKAAAAKKTNKAAAEKKKKAAAAKKVCVAHQLCTVKPSGEACKAGSPSVTRWYARKGKCHKVTSCSGFTTSCGPNETPPIMLATKGGCEKKCGIEVTKKKTTPGGKKTTPGGKKIITTTPPQTPAPTKVPPTTNDHQPLVIYKNGTPPPPSSVFPVSSGPSMGGGDNGVCSLTSAFGAPFPGQHNIKSLEQ